MTYKDWQKQRKVARKLAKLDDKYCANARAARDKESTRGKYCTANPPKSTSCTKVAMHIAVPSKLKIERVETKQLQRSRDTLQDYITRTDNLWLAAILRDAARRRL